MMQTLFYLASSFWIGAVHAATPGHGKTIAAAYIVGVRGRPVDAVILGIFVTLSHTSGIVLVAVLASLGSGWLVPQRAEAYLSVVTGLLVVTIGIWTLWSQRSLLPVARRRASPLSTELRVPSSVATNLQPVSPAFNYVAAAEPRSVSLRRAHRHSHGAHHQHAHAAEDHSGEAHHHDESGYHSHGWGTRHTHRLDLLGASRPSLVVLLGLGIAGGLLPDPAALAMLLSALVQGRVMLGLAMVVVFSLGFAATLVVVGVVAAQLGQRLLTWLSGPWSARVQLATSLLIVLVGIVLSANALRLLAALD